MKQCTLQYWLYVITLALITSFHGNSQTIASYDFETGLQGWIDGGSDSGLNTNNIYATSGTQSLYSKDDDLTLSTH